jgi:hypothetical protein
MLIVFGLVLAACAGILVWCAAARWWHPLVIGFLWIPVFPLVAHWLTGDVSHYLPPGVFSEGAQGKDEITVASALSTIVVAVAAAALVVWAGRVGWKRLRA